MVNIVQIYLKWSKIVQNGQRVSKMVRNCHRWSKIDKNRQNCPNGPKWSKIIQNGQKWSKLSEMVKNGQNGQNGIKWFQMVQTLTHHKSYKSSCPLRFLRPPCFGWWVTLRGSTYQGIFWMVLAFCLKELLLSFSPYSLWPKKATKERDCPWRGRIFVGNMLKLWGEGKS